MVVCIWRGGVFIWRLMDGVWSGGNCIWMMGVGNWREGIVVWRMRVFVLNLRVDIWG
jgi:hypothetical protein